MEIHIHIHNGMMPEMDEEMMEKMGEEDEEETEYTGMLGELMEQILGKARARYMVEQI